MMGSKPTPSAKGTEYKLSFKRDGWIEKKDERSDYVWENKNDGRILLSNSFCQQFQDQPLEILATKTFKGVSSLKLHKQGYTTFNDREAYRAEGSGKVDGVSVGLIILNTRRSNCYFDFVSITPLQSATEQTEVFETFLSGVQFK